MSVRAARSGEKTALSQSPSDTFHVLLVAQSVYEADSDWRSGFQLASWVGIAACSAIARPFPLPWRTALLNTASSDLKTAFWRLVASSQDVCEVVPFANHLARGRCFNMPLLTYLDRTATPFRVLNLDRVFSSLPPSSSLPPALPPPFSRSPSCHVPQSRLAASSVFRRHDSFVLPSCPAQNERPN